MNTNPDQPAQALLLLGPTGSGKSPLGDYLQSHGLGGRPCFHFDFGANLRAVVQRGPCADFSPAEIQFLRDALEHGALLENESFYLAEKILRTFIAANLPPSPALPLLILNGLPRHVGQATALEKIVHVTRVVQLECDASVILERLRLNSGGDRVGRTDDNAELVTRKLQTYRERTQPLISHYATLGIRTLSLPVGPATQAGEAARRLLEP
jgi:adenylate kinase